MNLFYYAYNVCLCVHFSLFLAASSYISVHCKLRSSFSESLLEELMFITSHAIQNVPLQGVQRTDVGRFLWPIFIAPAYSKVRYRGSTFRPSTINVKVLTL